MKALCSHERSLTGSTYDFYCRDALPTYARDTEDLLSFLSVRMKSDGTVNGDFYPTWTGILPSIFENGVIGVTFTAAGGEGLAPEGDAAAEAAAEEEREEGEEVDEDAEATATAPKKQRTEKLVELSKADLEKTAFLAEVVLRTTDSHRGVLIKNGRPACGRTRRSSRRCGDGRSPTSRRRQQRRWRWSLSWPQR